MATISRSFDLKDAATEAAKGSLHEASNFKGVDETKVDFIVRGVLKLVKEVFSADPDSVKNASNDLQEAKEAFLYDLQEKALDKKNCNCNDVITTAALKLFETMHKSQCIRRVEFIQQIIKMKEAEFFVSMKTPEEEEKGAVGE